MARWRGERYHGARSHSMVDGWVPEADGVRLKRTERRRVAASHLKAVDEVVRHLQTAGVGRVVGVEIVRQRELHIVAKVGEENEDEETFTDVVPVVCGVW